MKKTIIIIASLISFIAASFGYCLYNDPTNVFIFGINHRNRYLVSLALYFNADVNARIDNFENALQKVLPQDLEIAGLLLKYKIAPDHVKNLFIKSLETNDLRMAELFACHCDNKDEKIKAALLKVDDPEIFKLLAKNNFNLSQLLIKKAFFGNLEQVKKLVMLNTDANSKNYWKYTPLMGAVVTRNPEMVKFLIENGAGASINAANFFGDTSLLMAARNLPSPEVIKMLVDKGANINIANEKGEVPIELIVERPGNEEILKYLLDKGADLKSKNAALSRAINMRQVTYVDILINLNNSFRLIAEGKIHEFITIMNNIAGSCMEISQINSEDIPWKKAVANKLYYAKLNCERFDAMKTNSYDSFEAIIGVGMDEVTARGMMKIAAENSDIRFVQALVKRWVRIDREVFSHAIKMNCDEKILSNLLREYGEISSKDLNAAVKSGNIKIVKLLLDEYLKKYSSQRSENYSPSSKYVEPGHFVEPMYNAVYANDYEMTRFLLSKVSGKCVDIPNIAMDENFARHPLIWSIIEGFDEIAELLIESGADIRSKKNFGLTPLAYASWYGRTRLVELMLKKGAEPNIASNDGTTPLMFAAMAGNDVPVKLLLAGGADINAVNYNGYSALMEAITSQKTQTVELLKKSGADFSYAESALRKIKAVGSDINEAGRRGANALMRAAYSGVFEKAKFLIDHGAAVNKILWGFENIFGSEKKLNISILGLAANPSYYRRGSGAYELVKLLIDKGADPYYLNDGSAYEFLMGGLLVTDRKLFFKIEANNPLKLSVYKSGLPIELFLSTNMGSLNKSGLDFKKIAFLSRNNTNHSFHYLPFFIEAVKNLSTDNIEKLLKCGVDINSRSAKPERETISINNDYSDLQSFGYIKYYGSNAIAFIPDSVSDIFEQLNKLTILLKNGCEINSKNDFGYTPLMVAALKARPEIISFMLERGAAVNIVSTDELKFTAMFTAVQNVENPEIVELLIEKGAEIDRKAFCDWTPLMVAIRMRNLVGARILIRHGADVNAVNAAGQTPLDLAYEYLERNDPIINMLKCSGAARKTKHYENMVY